METKHIVIIAVVVAVFIGYMVIRNKKGEEELKEHHKSTYSRIVEMAKKSPRAGLDVMGRALKKYYAENESYPSSLDALYPKYISEKAFIDELKWEYEPKGDDFSLSKSVLRGDREMVATIDKSLRPRMAGTGVMVAAKEEAPEEAEVPEATMGIEVAAFEPPPVEYEVEEIRDTAARLDEVRRASFEETEVVSVDAFVVAASDEKTNVSALASEKVSEVEAEIASGIASDVTQRYLVWKNTNGVLGFGNVTYPREDDLSITARGKWYRIEREMPEIPKAVAMAIEPGTTRKKLDAVAASLQHWSMVWKDNNGNIGFGNVEYPKVDSLSISTGEEWYNLQRRSMEEKPASSGTEIETIKKAPEPERVASILSGHYLVWKDKQGAVGFGDVEYPEVEELKVGTGTGWETKTIRSQEQAEFVTLAAAGEQRKDMDGIAKSLSGNYLVWKDKNGTVGFGNVEYPGPSDISYIRDNRGWQKVVN